jgi:hypothetical protein
MGSITAVAEGGQGTQTKTPMTRRPSTFRPKDVTSALLASAAAGMKPQRIEILYQEGKIVLFFDGSDPQEMSKETPLDEWRANRGTR